MVRVGHRPNLFLLIALVVQVILYPWLQHLAHGKAALAMIDWLVLVLALRAARSTGVESRIGYLLFVPAIGLHALVVFSPSPALTLTSFAAQCAFHVFVIVCLVRYMLRDDMLKEDELYAAASLYVLLAFAFSFVYAALEQLMPGAFFINDANNPDGVTGWWELVYFSFNCLTRVGFGEITPVSDYARSVVMLGQMAGVLFLAIVISRLISAATPRRR